MISPSELTLMLTQYVRVPVALALLGVLAAAPAAADVLWTTNPDLPTFFTSAYEIPSDADPAGTREAVDDFNVIGSVERVLADGQDCSGCGFGQPVDGAWVRFYAWTASGPGALEKEYFFEENDPAFQWTVCCGPGFLQFDLPEPFQATGWHFVSVQTAFSADGHEWNYHRANVGNPKGGPAYYREDGGAWTAYHEIASWSPVDLSFALEGTPGGTPSPEILSVGPAPIHPSGRLEVKGSGLGATQGTSVLSVGGAPALVTQWTDEMIIAYVPESTPPGETQVTLEIGGIVADQVTISVLPRTADERVKWRFAVDADFLNLKPGIGPDGSVYVTDIQGRLYKLTPDGGLAWIVDTLRGQIGGGAEGPVVVDANGRAFVAANPLGPKVEIVAYEPDGTLAWVFTEPHGIEAVVGPAIGPDGNLYVAFHGPTGPSLGLCAISPATGALLWNNPGDPLFYEEGGTGAELAFGASQLGGPVDQIVLTVDQDADGKLYAFALADGQQRWVVAKGSTNAYFLQYQHEAATGPDGTAYLAQFSLLGGLGWGLDAFDPSDGSHLWRFDPGILSEASAPVTGPDGTVYFSWDISRVTAVTPSGSERWTHYDGGLIRSLPSLGPDGEMLLVAGGDFGEPGSFEALATSDGSKLWSVELPHESGDVVPDQRASFTPDGTTAYYPTVILADPEPFQYCYLYALRIDGGHVDTYGCGVNPEDSLTVLGGSAEAGQTLTLGVDNPLGTQSPGALPFVAISIAPTAAYPCGLLVPGLGMQGAGAPGELLISMGGPQPFLFQGSSGWAGAGNPAAVPIAFPPFDFSGLPLFAQGLLFDPTAASGVSFGLTEALRIQVGP